MKRPEAIIGSPLPRVEGREKVTGAIPYAAEHRIDPAPHHGWIVEATIGHGRVVGLDLARALETPGVVDVLSHRRRPTQRPYGEPEDSDRFSMSHALLYDDQIRYYGQPIALVVAETLEAAREAAGLVEARYEAHPARYRIGDDDGPEQDLEKPDELDGGSDADVCVGDFDTVWNEAEVRVDAIYTTPHQVSAAMEPHATIATWDGQELVVRTSLQILASGVEALATTLELDLEQVVVLSPHVGGGFGSKLGIHADAVLAALAAIQLKHPVKVVQHRRQLFTNGPHRGNSRQRLRLGARRDGTLVAVGHDSVMPMAEGYSFAEPVAAGARATYRLDALRTTHRVLPVNTPVVDSMRAPGEAIGTLALEGAMDELAASLGVDPLRLRLDNLAVAEPQSGKPFASNDLRRCLEEGASAFGWDRRPPPKQRDGRWWKGWGMAACTRFNLLMEAEAKVRLQADGKAIAELDMTDIGTGSYTILTQIVADTLGLEAEKVEVRLGDSRLPATAGSGGSFGAASAGGAVLEASRAVARALAERAVSLPDAPCSGREPEEADFRGGRVWFGESSLPLRELFEDGEPLEREGKVAPGEDQEKFAQYSYGAHFVELGVDAASGEVRLQRALGAFSFGRVLNPLTARSQLIGGITFGIGGALTEDLTMGADGAFVGRDLAEYHLPVQRDVPDLEVLMLGELDPKCGPLGSKGIGELGVCGIGGAIASAVFHATGIRVRDFPLTPDKLIPYLP